MMLIDELSKNMQSRNIDIDIEDLFNVEYDKHQT